MFTGIIETTGKVLSIEKDKTNLRFGIGSSFAKELSIGQSIAHNGVCLTVEKIAPKEKMYFVTAVKETLTRSNLGLLKKGSLVNLERCLKINDRLDGHFVQGHVDCTAMVNSIKKEKGSWLFNFQIKGQKSKVNSLVIEKGSICINGVSLTVVSPKLLTPTSELAFSVAIIPHTFTHTNFSAMKKGDKVNIEFDILGKYIQKIISDR
jgi:riboflavin synthase